jgi:hypothetical protein
MAVVRGQRRSPNSQTRHGRLPSSCYRMVLNLRTAKAIGVELPTSILLRADEVIE